MSPWESPLEGVQAIRFRRFHLELLDQRRLPHEEVWLPLAGAEDTARAIADMVVRGAPAIGITAGYGMALAAHRAAEAGADLEETLAAATEVLAGSRPTAVNLFWALGHCNELAAARRAEGASAAEVAEALAALALDMHRDDLARNRRMGELGAALLPDGARILTHCNAGALATGGHGTALGIIRSAAEQKKIQSVWVDETRPYLQGARLTYYELAADGIPAQLITDNMAGHFISRGTVDAVVVGTDRVAANGDVANKIGTYTVAVLCQRHGVPFYVACPLSTLDLDTPSGAEIPIEERSPKEVVEVFGQRIAQLGAHARHPAFDVTPAELVTAIITEAGVARAPYIESLAALKPHDR